MTINALGTAIKKNCIVYYDDIRRHNLHNILSADRKTSSAEDINQVKTAINNNEGFLRFARYKLHILGINNLDHNIIEAELIREILLANAINNNVSITDNIYTDLEYGLRHIMEVIN